MINTRNIKNITAITILVISTTLTIYTENIYGIQHSINKSIENGEIIKDDNFPYQEKFSAANYQSSKGDFKHSIQTLSQLLEMKSKLKLTNMQLSTIQYNIANNLFHSALSRRQNDDGSIMDEARNDLVQAKIAYEQSLRLNPNYLNSKFNLALLNSVLAEAPKAKLKEQSGVELSNLPIGLP